MSSESPEGRTRIRNPWVLGFRLLIAYAAIFAVSSVLLFGLAYTLFVYYSREPDRAFLREQAREMADLYSKGGIDAVRSELAREPDRRREELLVRLVDPQGRTLLLYNPDDWRQRELQELARQVPPEREAWLHLGPAEDQDALQAYSLRLPNGYIVQAGMDSDVREDVLQSMREVFVMIALPVLLLALLGGALVAYRALRPVRSLLRTLQTIMSTGDVERRVPLSDVRGEFADLADLFNQMLDRLQLLLRAMRSALDDVAHDLRTPLTHLRGTAELALQKDDAAAVREALADCMEASERILVLLDSLMTVSEAEAGTMQLNPRSVALSEILEGVVDLYRLLAEEKEITLEAQVSPTLMVYGDVSRLRQVFGNLIDNAVKYTAPGGRVRIDGRNLPGAGVEVTVEDTGIGIAEDDLPHIWNRLYRGDHSRSERGLGLGLSLVRAIIEAHGGQVFVTSEPGRGTVFTVRLAPSQTLQAYKSVSNV